MTNRSDDVLDAEVDYPPGWTPGAARAEPPRRRGWAVGWAVGSLALVLTVVTLVAIVSGRESRHPGAGDGRVGPEVAVAQANTLAGSAADRGSVEVITSDATCGPWDDVRSAVVAAQTGAWGRRDASLPRQQWDPARSRQFEAMGVVLRTAADQTVALAKQTPHRAMRELYETFISYGREYADALRSYQPADDFLARTALAASDTVTNICAAADGSSRAILRAQGVPPVAAPSTPPTIGDLDDPARFLGRPPPSCGKWVPSDVTLRAQTRAWPTVDPAVGRNDWTAAQRAVVERTAQVVASRADDMEAWGRAADNQVFEDLATLGAQYFRAYGLGVPTYRPGDERFANAGFAINGLITAACQTVGG